MKGERKKEEKGDGTRRKGKGSDGNDNEAVATSGMERQERRWQFICKKNPYFY